MQAQFHITNEDFKNKTQNPLAILITYETHEGKMKWILKIVDPTRPHALNGGLLFTYDTRFGVIQYYADYIRYLLGADIEKPKSWNYKTDSHEAPEGFDFTPYNGKTVATKPEYIKLRFYALPESNGRNNWSVIPSCSRFKSYELLTFLRTEKYYEGWLFFKRLQYLLGEINIEPNEKDYDLTLYRDSKTGEFYHPEYQDKS